MNKLKIFISIILILVGLTTLVIFGLSLFSEWFKSTYSDFSPRIAQDYWGVFSAVFLTTGGISLLLNSKNSIWLLLLSIICYFLGAIIPMWPEYGIESFNAVLVAFYYSLIARIVVSAIGIYAMYKVLATQR